MKPAMQTQEDMALLPSGEMLEAGQDVQALGPVTVLYFPFSQAEQGPPSGPVYPLMHALAHDTDPASAYVPAAQKAHVVSPEL